jgi:hypothetical protein
MRSLLKSYRHVGIREVPRGEALELIGALEAHGACVAQLGWGRVCWCDGADGETIRVMIAEDRAQRAVVRWDAPCDAGRRVELEREEIVTLDVPVSRGSNGGRELAAALLARVPARVGVRG